MKSSDKEMIQLSYISMANTNITEAVLNDILYTSLKMNKEHDVTGMLLFSNNTFVQVIEGPQSSIDRLYELLLKDERHKNVVQTLYQRIWERSFPDWQMGFTSETEIFLKGTEGYSDFLSNDSAELSDEIRQGIGRATLERFKRCYL